MFTFSFKSIVTDKVYRAYINTGKVSKGIITVLAKKVMAGTELSDKEFAIFCGLTSEVNDEIKKLAKND
jgi:hypothetical protein